MNDPRLAEDEMWPRDADHRFRLYAHVPGARLEVLAAAPSMAGLGLAIQTLHEEAVAAGRRLADEGRIGVLDVMPGGLPAPRGDWVVQPFDRVPA